jgi:hypothetical protein
VLLSRTHHARTLAGGAWSATKLRGAAAPGYRGLCQGCDTLDHDRYVVEAPFAEHGHETFAIDIDRCSSAAAYIDIGEVAGRWAVGLPWLPDVIFTSPH